MNIEKNFNEFYNKLLSEHKTTFDELETQRKNSIRERKINKQLIFIVEFLILIILCVINFDLEENTFLLLILGAFAFPIIIAINNRKKLELYERTYQDKIINSLIKYFSLDLKYYPNKYISSEDYKKIAPEGFEHFYSSNLIHGNFKNTEITISKIFTKCRSLF